MLWRSSYIQAFQSTLPRGSDCNSFQCLPAANHFNPRSLAGATITAALTRQANVISIHAPSRERRQSRFILHMIKNNFNPRSLAGATVFVVKFKISTRISIHAPSRERLKNRPQAKSVSVISIHAPSRERPLFSVKIGHINSNFNPRSLAGATAIPSSPIMLLIHFNPRSLAGAT